MSDNNLELWKLVEKTDPQHVKKITGKSYSGTSPKPHWLVMRATEAFGPVGIGWGYAIEERVETGALCGPNEYDRVHLALVRVWYMWKGQRGEVEHMGGTPLSGRRKDGKPFTDEDAAKKSVTDALVKALSMIGFAGDIFMGRYDDSKYVEDVRHEFEETKEPSPVEKYISMTSAIIKTFAGNPDDLRDWWVSKSQERRDFGLSQEQVDKLKAEIVNRMAQLNLKKDAA